MKRNANRNSVHSSRWNSIGMGISMGLVFRLLAGKNRDKKAKTDDHLIEL